MGIYLFSNSLRKYVLVPVFIKFSVSTGHQENINNIIAAWLVYIYFQVV